MRRRGYKPRFQDEVEQMGVVLGDAAPNQSERRRLLKRTKGDLEGALDLFLEESSQLTSNDLDANDFEELRDVIGDHVPRALLQELLLGARGSVEAAANNYFSREPLYRQRVKQLAKLRADLAFGKHRLGQGRIRSQLAWLAGWRVHGCASNFSLAHHSPRQATPAAMMAMMAMRKHRRQQLQGGQSVPLSIQLLVRSRVN